MSNTTIFVPISQNDSYLLSTFGALFNQDDYNLRAFYINKSGSQEVSDKIDSEWDIDDRIDGVVVNKTDKQSFFHCINNEIFNGNVEVEDYVAITTSGFLWKPDKLTKQTQVMERSNTGVCGTQLIQGRQVSSFPLEHSQIVEQLLSGVNPFCFDSILIKADLFNTIGSFNHLMVGFEIYEWLLRAAKLTKFCNIDAALVEKQSRFPEISSSKYMRLVSAYRSLGII